MSEDTQAHLSTMAQPPPTETDASQPVLTFLSVSVIEHMLIEPGLTQTDRVNLGRIRADLQRKQGVSAVEYGTLLKSHNGRNALIDSFQEMIDSIMYLAQAVLEENAVPKDLLTVFKHQILLALQLRQLIDPVEVADNVIQFPSGSTKGTIS